MIYKLGKAMAESDDCYTLKGMIEANEGYFSVEDAQKGQLQKLGRFSNTKSTVMIMAESTVLEDVETKKKGKHVGYFKAKILPDHKSKNTDLNLKQAIEINKSIVFSDDSTSCVNIVDYVELHISEKSSEQTTKETLKWVHIAIGNAERNFAETYHKIKIPGISK